MVRKKPKDVGVSWNQIMTKGGWEAVITFLKPMIASKGTLKYLVKSLSRFGIEIIKQKICTWWHKELMGTKGWWENKIGWGIWLLRIEKGMW